MPFKLGRVGLFHFLLLLIDLPKIEGPHDDPFPTLCADGTYHPRCRGRKPSKTDRLVEILKQAAKAVWNNRGAIIEQVKHKPKPDPPPPNYDMFPGNQSEVDAWRVFHLWTYCHIGHTFARNITCHSTSSVNY